MKVENFIEKNRGPVFTVNPQDTVAEVSRKFGEMVGDKRYSAAVVCEEGDKVVGIVSLGDITWTVGRLEEKAPKLEVSHIMTTDVASCTMDDMLEDVLKEMARRGIRHMPVVRDGRLIGLVARREALEFLYHWAKLDVDNLTDWLFNSEARY
jgi:CBS domain-containing protein